jgi:RHS repeat-associated protein
VTDDARPIKRTQPGIDGQLAAIQNNGEIPVLEFTNLHGDIIATAYFRKPRPASPRQRTRRSAACRRRAHPRNTPGLARSSFPTELPSGVIEMGALSYVPQLGRFLQPDPIAGGSADAYAYTFGDPLNGSDPSRGFGCCSGCFFGCPSGGGFAHGDFFCDSLGVFGGERGEPGGKARFAWGVGFWRVGVGVWWRVTPRRDGHLGGRPSAWFGLLLRLRDRYY